MVGFIKEVENNLPYSKEMTMPTLSPDRFIFISLLLWHFTGKPKKIFVI